MLVTNHRGCALSHVAPAYDGLPMTDCTMGDDISIQRNETDMVTSRIFDYVIERTDVRNGVLYKLPQPLDL